LIQAKLANACVLSRLQQRGVFDRIIVLHPALVILGAWSPQYQATWSDRVDETISRLEEAVLKVVVLGFGPCHKSPVPQILADRDKANNLKVISDDDLLRQWTLTTTNSRRS
jgi:hypothetical protein